MAGPTTPNDRARRSSFPVLGYRASIIVLVVAVVGFCFGTYQRFFTPGPHDDSSVDWLGNLLGPWIWPMGIGVFGSCLVWFIAQGPSYRPRYDTDRAHVRARLLTFAVVFVPLFGIALLVAVAAGKDHVRVRQAIGAISLSIAFAVMFSRENAIRGSGQSSAT